MPRKTIDQNGFAHYLLLLAGVAVLVIASGYLVYAHTTHSVSISGILTGSNCSSKTTCNEYSLKSGNKSYNLSKLSGLPSQVSPGSTVSVTGTSSNADPSQVSVKSITTKSGGSGSAATSTTASPPQPLQPIYPHDVTFNSTIAADTCSTVDNPNGPPVGDAGCDITTANGWTIQVHGGNVNNPTSPGRHVNDPTPPGQLENAPPYNQSWKGKQVSVYAQATSENEGTILSASKYYVKF